MELTGKEERVGFAPSKYICPYHIWKPRGVLRSCTCSPTPAHQMRWEEKVFDSGEDIAVHQATLQADSSIYRCFLDGIDVKRIATLSRTSGKTLVSVLRAARNGFAGLFRRVYEDARVRQRCETELQKTGGPECQI